MARTPKLTDTQMILLATACQRNDGSIVPPPERLSDQIVRVRKSIAGLIKHGMVAEIDGTDTSQSPRDKKDRFDGLIITDVGRAIIAASDNTADAPRTQACLRPASGTRDITAARVLRPGTKQALVVDLLRGNGGASIAELAGATGWLPHTTRAALTGLRKRGFAIATEKADGLTRYRLAVGDR